LPQVAAAPPAEVAEAPPPEAAAKPVSEPADAAAGESLAPSLPIAIGLLGFLSLLLLSRLRRRRERSLEPTSPEPRRQRPVPEAAAPPAEPVGGAPTEPMAPTESAAPVPPAAPPDVAAPEPAAVAPHAQLASSQPLGDVLHMLQHLDARVARLEARLGTLEMAQTHLRARADSQTDELRAQRVALSRLWRRPPGPAPAARPGPAPR
nr:hypothetical protein [Myxococcota bacterium]